MGQLANIVQHFRDGDITWDQMVQEIKVFPFRVRTDKPTGLDALYGELDHSSKAVEDTFEELSRFWPRGWLTMEQASQLRHAVTPERPTGTAS